MNKYIFLVPALVLSLCVSKSAYSQDTTVVLSTDMFNTEHVIYLSNLDGWVFRPGHDPAWADPDLDTSDWEVLKPSDLTTDFADESGLIEGWFRFRFQLDSTFAGLPLGWRSGTFGAKALYLDGEKILSFGIPDADRRRHQSFNPWNRMPDPATLETGREYVLAFYLVDHHRARIDRITLWDATIDPMMRLTGPEYPKFLHSLILLLENFQILWITALFLLTFLFWVISFQSRGEYMFRLIAWINTFFLITALSTYGQTSIATNQIQMYLLNFTYTVSAHVIFGLIPMIVSQMLKGTISRQLKIFFGVMILVGTASFFTGWALLAAVALTAASGIAAVNVWTARARIVASQWIVMGGLVLSIFWILFILLYPILTGEPSLTMYLVAMSAIYLTFPISLLLFISMRYKEILFEIQNNAHEVVRLTSEKLEAEKEKQVIVANQKKNLEQEVDKRTQELRDSLENLRATQEQLVQQEKLASLGQLTAGIAHEIKNPLNFVNNFSDVSLEMVDEALDELKKISGKGDAAAAAAILAEIKSNLAKIHEHGSRADGIVKSMLQHSRGGSGKMEPTDLNALIREYVNLSFHGMRAAKDPINVEIDLQLDEDLGQVPLIVEDFSRVILNLCNNAFDAMREKIDSESTNQNVKYLPKLTVSAKFRNGAVIVEIEDNGPGIPDEIKDKILQPFFTTKKGTQGTGLGLSITNDIIKAHGGDLQIQTKQLHGTLFLITLPQNR